MLLGTDKIKVEEAGRRREAEGCDRGTQSTLFINYFIFSLLSCCCHAETSSCSELGLLFFAACRLLAAVAPLVAEHGLGTQASVVVVHGLG